MLKNSKLNKDNQQPSFLKEEGSTTIESTPIGGSE